MKKVLIFPILLSLLLKSNAQSLDQARKFLYYERFRSAISLLDQLVKNDPKNPDFAYWLALAYLSKPEPDQQRAKAVFQSAISANPGNALLIAGMGQIDLQENKTSDATTKFMEAGSKAGKDAEIWMAIARSNIGAKNGNYNYAIEILNKALDLKKVDKFNVFILIGNAYRKLIDGGNAVGNYEKAKDLDPKNALPYVREAKIYSSQQNYEVMIPLLEKAIEADPAYAPAYLDLYEHYSLRDVNKAKEYLDKYLANADLECSNDLFAADYLFRAGKYQEALNRSAQLAQGNCKNEIANRLLMLNAFCHDRLGDSIAAKTDVEEFFAKEDPTKILPTDYEIAAKTYGRFPGSESKAIIYINKAYESDSAGRLGYLYKLIDLYKKTGDNENVAVTYDKILLLKPRPSNLDLYYCAMAHFTAKQYTRSYELWQQYKDKYPDQIHGYLYRIKCNEAQDTAMLLGLALPHWENMLGFAMKDTLKYKTQLLSVLFKLVIYYVNVKKDKQKGIDYLTQYIQFDPLNEEAKQNLKKLKGG